MEDFTPIAEMIQTFGVWIIFVYLYIQEKKAHQQTRYEYREDLREIAGIRQSLVATQRTVTEWKADNENPN